MWSSHWLRSLISLFWLKTAPEFDIHIYTRLKGGKCRTSIYRISLHIFFRYRFCLQMHFYANFCVLSSFRLCVLHQWAPLRHIQFKSTWVSFFCVFESDSFASKFNWILNLDTDTFVTISMFSIYIIQMTAKLSFFLVNFEKNP